MTHVLVVGGGLAGCSVASQLAPHVRVTLLEQGEQLGAEASAQNAGMVRRMGEDPFERALALRTHEWMEDPGPDWAELQPSRRTGAVLALAHDPWHLHDAAAHLVARGVPIEEVDEPGRVAPALVGSGFQRAWYLPEERVADGHSLVTGFAQQARRHGAQIRLRCGVMGLLVRGGKVCGLKTDSGDVEADAVVLAAGAWSAQLAATAGLSRPLIALRRTLLQSAPHPTSRPDHPWTWIDDVGLYVRPEAGGFMVSGCDEAVDLPTEGPGSMGPVEPEHRALAHDKLERFLPALADLRMVGGWTGLRTFAPDRRPVLGADGELDGLWWAAGLGGFGVTCSYAVGEAVATWFLGGHVPWLHRESVSPNRAMPTRWPIRPDGELGRARLIGLD